MQSASEKNDNGPKRHLQIRNNIMVSQALMIKLGKQNVAEDDHQGKGDIDER